MYASSPAYRTSLALTAAQFKCQSKSQGPRPPGSDSGVRAGQSVTRSRRRVPPGEFTGAAGAVIISAILSLVTGVQARRAGVKLFLPNSVKRLLSSLLLPESESPRRFSSTARVELCRVGPRSLNTGGTTVVPARRPTVQCGGCIRRRPPGTHHGVTPPRRRARRSDSRSDQGDRDPDHPQRHSPG
eukprot:767517-Hanusia_phi.AAC.7